MRALLTTTALSVLALASASCAKILGIEDTDVLLLRDNLACIDGVPDAPTGTPGEATSITASIVSIETGEPIAGVQVRRCATRLDLTCAGDLYVSDAEGNVTVPVTVGFNGYLKIQDPVQDNASNRLVTYFWYFSEAIGAPPRATPFPIFAMTRGFRDAVLYSSFTGSHAARGEVAINATDCSDLNASGITFELTTPASFDEQTEPFYQSDVNILINPATQQTDEAGLGGFLGVRPGSVGIRSIDAATGTVIATDTLLVQPDVLTTVRLLPQ